MRGVERRHIRFPDCWSAKRMQRRLTSRFLVDFGQLGNIASSLPSLPTDGVGAVKGDDATLLADRPSV